MLSEFKKQTNKQTKKHLWDEVWALKGKKTQKWKLESLDSWKPDQSQLSSAPWRSEKEHANTGEETPPVFLQISD